MVWLRNWVVVIAVVLIAGCSSPEPDVPVGTEVYIHEGSKIPFPPEFSGFARGVISESEDSVDVPYSLTRGKEKIKASIRVYPNPDAPAEEKPQDPFNLTESMTNRMTEIQAELEAASLDEEYRFIASYDLAIARGEKSFMGKRVYFRTRENAFTNAYLFEYGPWFVEYRVEFDRNLDQLSERILNDHSWGDLKK
jgi:hypothetical protein